MHINSSCVSFTNLITGRTDGLILATQNPWDIMPGEFMCEELGFKVNYLDLDKKTRLITINEEIRDLILSNK